MQTQATSFGTCPGMLAGKLALGDNGTLVMHAGGKWFYVRGDDWHPGNGMTSREFIRVFGVAPPMNVANNSWGIVPGLNDRFTSCDRNWTMGEIQAAIDQFVGSIAARGEFIKPNGVGLDTLNKGKKLAWRRRQFDSRICKAPRPEEVSAPSDKQKRV